MTIGKEQNICEYTCPYIEDGLVSMFDANSGIRDGLIRDLVTHTACQVPNGITYSKNWLRTNFIQCKTDFKICKCALSKNFSVEVVLQFHDSIGLDQRIFLSNCLVDACFITISSNGGFGASCFNGSDASFMTLDQQVMRQKMSVSFTYSDNECYCYMNGSKRGKASSTSKVTIPSLFYLAYGRCDTSFGCVRVYDRALSESEVVSNFEVDKRRFEI